MRFLSSLAAAAVAFAGCSMAQSSVLGFTSLPTNFTAGQASLLSYTAPDLTAAVIIILLRGSTGNLVTVQTLTDDATGGNYTWTPLPSIADGDDYELQLEQGDQINYSGAITLSGANPAAVSSASALTASQSSAAAALSSSYASEASISSIESIISSYNSSLQNLTAPRTTSTTGTGLSSIGRNSSLVSATLTSTATVTGSSASSGSTAGSGTATSTGSSPASTTSKGAAVMAVSAITGASPLALVFCVFAGVFL